MELEQGRKEAEVLKNKIAALEVDIAEAREQTSAAVEAVEVQAAASAVQAWKDKADAAERERDSAVRQVRAVAVMSCASRERCQQRCLVLG